MSILTSVFHNETDICRVNCVKSFLMSGCLDLYLLREVKIGLKATFYITVLVGTRTIDN